MTGLHSTATIDAKLIRHARQRLVARKSVLVCFQIGWFPFGEEEKRLLPIHMQVMALPETLEVESPGEMKIQRQPEIEVPDIQSLMARDYTLNLLNLIDCRSAHKNRIDQGYHKNIGGSVLP